MQIISPLGLGFDLDSVIIAGDTKYAKVSLNSFVWVAV